MDVYYDRHICHITHSLRFHPTKPALNMFSLLWKSDGAILSRENVITHQKRLRNVQGILGNVGLLSKTTLLALISRDLTEHFELKFTKNVQQFYKRNLQKNPQIYRKSTKTIHQNKSTKNQPKIHKEIYQNLQKNPQKIYK